jgi:NarL family two-component system response regulator LiaR
MNSSLDQMATPVMAAPAMAATESDSRAGKDDLISVLIADDHAIVRKGLRTLIASEPGMEVAGEAADGLEAVEQARTLQPDVILLDLVMPHQSGLEALVEIRHANPNARVLVLTSFAEPDKVLPAIRAGALGYLLKDTTPEELLHAIYNVCHGEPHLHPSIARMVLRELESPSLPSGSHAKPDQNGNGHPTGKDPLTDREVEVLQLVARGLTNQDIAKSLVISERTVGNHIGSILRKLRLANRTQAALYALRQGLATLEGQ